MLRSTTPAAFVLTVLMFRRILAQPTRIIVYDMRLNWGAVPGSPDFVPDQAWKALKEPSPWAFQVIATPIGIAAASFLGELWFLVTPLRYISQPLPLASLLFSLPVLVVVHELIHAAVHPMAGRSPHSILGFWPSRVVFYAHYDGELTRDRFLVVLLMPFVAISIFPLLIAAVSHYASWTMAFVSTVNALLACGDLLGAGMVLFQIPIGTIVRNQGWKTYWRKPGTLAG